MARLVALLSLAAHTASFQITVLQPKMTSLKVNKTAQLALLDSAAAAAAAAGSNVLVCPELYLSGYNLGVVHEHEVRGGPSYAAVQSMAVKHNVSILFTYPEKDAATDSTYDSAALIFRNGSSLADYRKVNLAAGEDLFAKPGSEFSPVVELDGIRVGILICFDVFLPEPARILALQGVEVILIPTANGYPLGINVLSSVIVPARGLENNAFVAYVNWVQDDPSFPEFLTFHGQTTVSDTGGNLLYVGPADTAALAHILLNFTGYNPGSTVYNRPSPDVNGLCGNVTSPSN